MRLRLRIERNDLPPTQALWPVKDPKNTIAQLLQRINEVFPLEADTWGLEDYSVSVSGYECLHYHEIGEVCKDEDEVIIRPLQFVDLKQRTMTGRDQIAADGRHMVDGVPFGRPCLKGAVRPEIRIPPRKKRRLLEGEDEQAAPLMLTEGGEELDEDDADENEDFEANDIDDEGETSQNSSSEVESGSSDSESSTDDTSSDSEEDEKRQEVGGENDESWEGLPSSEPSTPKRKAKSSQQHESSYAQSRPDAAAGASKRKRQTDEDHTEVSHLSSKRQKQSGANTTRSSHETAPKPAAQPPKKKDAGIPYEGTDITRTRNARRRDAKKLKYLKTAKVLPPDANMEAFHLWQESNKATKPRELDEDNTEEMMNLASVTTGEQAVEATSLQDDDSTTGMIGDALTHESEEEHMKAGNSANGELTSPSQPKVHKGTDEKTAEDEARAKLKMERKQRKKDAKEAKQALSASPVTEAQRQKLLSAIESGGIDVTASAQSRQAALESESELPEEASSKRLSESVESPAPEASTSCVIGATTMIPRVVARRSKLDLAGSKRLLFGSLGVRVPKTQEEKDQLQKKLAERTKRNAVTTQPDEVQLNGELANAALDESERPNQAENEPDDPNDWRFKIRLTAVECCDDRVTLSAPPFPFYQRWDPQYRGKKKQTKRGRNTYSDLVIGKKRKRGQVSAGYEETYDKYNTDGNGDALEYDEVGEEEDADEYWEDGALLGEDGYEDDVEEEHDGFPELPTNIDELPLLNTADATKDDFITFNELACDESTEWQPKMVPRTAQIVETPSANHAVVIQLSRKDLKPKFFDAEGNRVYSKFEMPGDDEGEDGMKEVVLDDLGPVRLAQRAQR